MRTSLPTQITAVSHRTRSPARGAWPALLGVLALACVTPPSAANASEPAVRGGVCDGGRCNDQSPAVPREAVAPAKADAGEPGTSSAAPSAPPASAGTNHAKATCDTEWLNGQDFIIQIGRRKDDGKPLRPFRPNQPRYPYELSGGRFLFGEEGMVYTAVGRFESQHEGEEALKRVESERPNARAFLTTLGPYLAPESRTCKINPLARMKNPAVDSASWILEKEGVLLAGSQTQCKDGELTKTVTVMSCDGMRTLLTDTSQYVCERTDWVDTCVYSLEPGVLLLKYSHTINGEITLDVRVYDVRKKERLFQLRDSHGGVLVPGLDWETEPRTDLEDVDQDGIPEIVDTVPKTGERTSVRQWHQGRFVEKRTP